MAHCGLTLNVKMAQYRCVMCPHTFFPCFVVVEIMIQIRLHCYQKAVYCGRFGSADGVNKDRFVFLVMLFILRRL